MSGAAGRALARAGVAVTLASALYACLHHALPSSREFPERPPLGVQIERAGRALTGNALIEPLAPDAVSDRRKEEYNRAAPADWPQFRADIERSLGLYDGFDGIPANQWLADAASVRVGRYRRLALVLLDDRLWVNSTATACTRYLAVELDVLAGAPNADCGGRTPNYDAVDVFRSLLATGTITGVEDGVDRDDRVHSVSRFPFLAAP